MSYIAKAISRDEKLLSISRPHWIYLLEGLLWFAGLSVLGLIVDHYFYLYVGAHAFTFKVDLWLVRFDERHTPIPWIFVFTGVAIFWPLLLAYISTEVALTSQRIIHKRGLLFVEIDQVDLDDIRAEYVFHGLFGWLLGYGRIHLNCRFIEDVWLPAIRDPYRLIKASHHARMKHPEIEYGPDEFSASVDEIEQKRKEAGLKSKMAKIKEALKRNFRKAA